MPLTEAGAAVIASGIGAASQLSAQGIGNVRNQKKWEKRQKFLEDQQIRAEKRQYDYNKDLQDYAYAQNLEQWNRENAYNSPSAQMSRFAAAGLNPNLIYGDSGAALAANSPQMSLDPVGTGSSNVAPYAQEGFGANFDYVSAARLGLDSQLVKAQVQKMNAETLGILNDNDFKDASFDLRLENLAEGIANTIADTDVKTSTSENIRTDTEGKKIANEIADATKETQIQQAAENLENTKREGWNLVKMGRNIDAATSKMHTETSLIKVQKRIAELDEKIRKVDADNADVLMDLRKQREGIMISYYNNQTRLFAKELRYYDRKALAQLALSAAEQFNRTAFGKLANSETLTQDFKNKMNEILLDPTKSTDARTYFSALILKNMNETNALDVLKFVAKEFEGVDFGNGSPSAPSDEKKNDSSVNNEPSHTSESDLYGIARRYWKDWNEQHPNATPEQRQQYLDYLGKRFAD